MHQKGKLNWWLLYATLPLMVVLLMIDGQFHGSLLEHRIIEVGIVVLVFGSMAFWVRANRTGLVEEQMTESYQVRVHVLSSSNSASPELDLHYVQEADGREGSSQSVLLQEKSPDWGRYN